MNKTQLIDAIALETGFSKDKSRKALNALIKVGVENLAQGERIIINNVGSFSIIHRAPRVGRNPRTGLQFIIEPKKVVRFRPNCPPPH